MGVHAYTASMRARSRADLVESTGSPTPYLSSGLASIDLAHLCHGDMDTGLAIAGDMAQIRRIKVR